MNIAFLSLGGNMGNRLGNLEKAAREIMTDCGHILASSAVFETEPWGTDSRAHFLNLVLKIGTPLQAEELLERLMAIERALGRRREGTLNEDRLIDIDILLFNNDISEGDALQLPHPRLHQRRFVLVPLAEVAPGLIHPRLNKSITRLLEACADPLGVKWHAPKMSFFNKNNIFGQPE